MVFVKTSSRGSATCVTGPAGPPHHAATLADSTARHPWQTGFSDDHSPPELQPKARRSPAVSSYRQRRWNPLTTWIWRSGCLSRPSRYVSIAKGHTATHYGSFDIMWSVVTMDNGVLVIGGGAAELPELLRH